MRSLTIFYTTDTHGCLGPVDYATGRHVAAGLSNCAAEYIHDGNTLILDGGDTIQGSPFTYWLQQTGPREESVPARVLNLAGVQYLTLGNHDFNYGQENLCRFLSELDGVCLCANVEGLPYVKKTVVHVLENGLRVGLTGIITPFVNVWEKPENIAGLTISDPVPAAAAALEDLRAAGADLTVCIYHGGFENDLASGAVLSDTGENQGYAICRDLGFDILLTGHQHMEVESACLFGTAVCQTADKAKKYIRMNVEADDDGTVHAVSTLVPAGTEPLPEIWDYLAPLEEQTSAWLDTPMGHLDTELLPGDHVKMAADGSLIASFFNQVQLEASGADISCTSLGNEVKGFSRDVTIRDVVSTYIYPNTLKTLQVDRSVLKAVLERSAEYFDYDGDGGLCVSDAFLQPKVEHYNYDYFSGIEVTMDVRRKPGARVLSIRWQGEELPDGLSLRLCMNNYRATGTGGYDAYKTCPLVREQPNEIAEMIMEYIAAHRDIVVDKTKWLTVLR